MAEQDWVPSFLRDSSRITTWFGIFAGTTAVVLALMGYPGAKTWIVGESRPRHIWLDHPNWQMLAFGIAIIAWNLTTLWRRRQRSRSARPRNRH